MKIYPALFCRAPNLTRVAEEPIPENSKHSGPKQDLVSPTAHAVTKEPLTEKAGIRQDYFVEKFDIKDF